MLFVKCKYKNKKFKWYLIFMYMLYQTFNARVLVECEMEEHIGLLFLLYQSPAKLLLIRHI